MTTHRFKVGQHVRVSQYGLDHNLVPKTRRDQTGIVVKVDEYNCPTVLWDGRKTPQGYHPKFIAPDRRRKGRTE